VTAPAPESVNLTDAASILVAMLDDTELGESHRLAAVMIWTSLTGLDREEAVAFARGIVAGTYSPYPVRYFLPPL
jgi:hypothetical protein